MKRIQEKVKDIVEVRPYESLSDFSRDPSLTVSNYHFSDATSDMMVKWLDAVALVGQAGVCNAIAGYRGVGKSHFLAMLSTVASHPELRSKVTEPHVVTAAQRLLRRHYPVVNVRRGLRSSLFEELTDAISKTLDLRESELGDNVVDLLNAAKAKSADLPLILIIDTAAERTARVDRDDGNMLAGIADAAKRLGIFVGLALDDDIAGADGSNSAIVSAFSVDYLDPEHLYKVVNARIFPKNSRMQGVLSRIYSYFREAIPHFRWSEQRFSSLYPLHPVTLEIAPYIRLFVPDFAILGFASEAGEKILGRPADSLIGLEEVFDKAESGLRKIDDLKDAFEAYDDLSATAVGTLPVMQRHRAKLVLKALLLFSLDGRGASAGEIAASMMIFDENDPNGSAGEIETVVKLFVSSMPDRVSIYSESQTDNKYGFRLDSRDDLKQALNEAITELSSDVAQAVLRRAFRFRFSDCVLGLDDEFNEVETMLCPIEWRGGIRRGLITTSNKHGSLLADNPAESDWIDWSVFIDFDGNTTEPPSDSDSLARISWRPDQLMADEVNTLLAYHAISSSIELREKFSDQLPTALHAYTSALEAIVERVMLSDARIVIDGFDYNFSEEARNSDSLFGLFSIMLEPLFETRFPEHPYFAKSLGEAEVETFVAEMYSSSGELGRAAGDFAVMFGAPIGLAANTDHGIVATPKAQLEELPHVGKVLQIMPQGILDVLPLRLISAVLIEPPVGLAREAQQLVLAAMVANGLVEFVTSAGNRINGRSLDLKIVWGEIAGIAWPRERAYSQEKLIRWARIISGTDQVTSLDSPDDRSLVLEALAKMASKWDNDQTLSSFEGIPEHLVNTEIWKLASKSSETVGAMISEIENAIDGSIDLEECLERIANFVGDSEDEFMNGLASLAIVESFSAGYAERERIRAYLALSEYTFEAEIEKLRHKLTVTIDASITKPSDTNNRELGYAWNRFHRAYSEHYLFQHDTTVRSVELKEKYDEIVRSEKWWYFSKSLRVPMIKEKYWHRVREFRHRISKLDCNFDTNASLATQPFCQCSFRLSEKDIWERLPQHLWEEIERGLDAFSSLVAANGELLSEKLAAFGKRAKDRIEADAAKGLIKQLQSGTALNRLSELQMDVLISQFDQIDRVAKAYSNEISIAGNPFDEDAPEGFPFGSGQHDSLDIIEINH